MLTAVVLSLSGGMFSVLAICPIKKIAWQFIRLIAGIELVVAISVLTWWAYGAAPMEGRSLLFPASFAVILGLSSFGTVGLAPLLGRQPITISKWLRLLAACGGVAGVISAWVGPDQMEGLTVGSRILVATSHTLSALLLGSVTIAWLLGHRYLTATEMTIDPLRRAAQVLIAALIARWVFAVAMLATAFAVPAESAVASFSPLSAEWLMVSIRVGIGLVLPSMFAYMAWDCVRLRSTQSATGILFFMSIFVTIGELTSHYLTGRLGWPL